MALTLKNFGLSREPGQLVTCTTLATRLGRDRRY
jgi:hypothetical protein